MSGELKPLEIHQDPSAESGTRLALLLASSGLLLLFGLIMVLSASSTAGLRMKTPSPVLFFDRQVQWAAIALLAGGFAAFLNFRKLLNLAPWLMAGIFLLLLLVFAPVIGGAFGGAHRWLRFGYFRVQPSEAAKIVLVLFVAWWMMKGKWPLSDFKKGLVPALSVVLGLAGIIFIEPNISACGIVAILGFSLLYFAGAKLRHLIPVGLMLSVLALTAAFLFFPHFRSRLAGFSAGEESAASYHAVQGLIALGNGGFDGVGLGNSVQKFGFLPEAYTDYIFAIIGEELGFLGAALIILFFLVFIGAGFAVALKARHPAARLVAAGISLTIGLEALLNMLVVTKLFPTTGVALPFISFGGSSLVINAFSVGLLVNIERSET